MSQKNGLDLHIITPIKILIKNIILLADLNENRLNFLIAITLALENIKSAPKPSKGINKVFIVEENLKVKWILFLDLVCIIMTNNMEENPVLLVVLTI